MNEAIVDCEHTNQTTTSPDDPNFEQPKQEANAEYAQIADDATNVASPTNPHPSAPSASLDPFFDRMAPSAPLPANADEDLDPDHTSFRRQASVEAFHQLYNELTALKAAVNQQNERSARMDREYTEFCELYPEVSVHTIADEVWSNVEQQGLPLAAAYALYERKRLCTERKAAESNEQNRVRAVGKPEAAPEGEYTPEEVRTMSAKEVRRHLPKIMRSMQKWK